MIVHVSAFTVSDVIFLAAYQSFAALKFCIENHACVYCKHKTLLLTTKYSWDIDML